MIAPRLLLAIGGTLCCFSTPLRALPGFWRLDTPSVIRKDQALTIGVTDFVGADRELGGFIAETLLTDLTRSNKLTLVERAQINKALTELKLEAAGLARPETEADQKKVRQLGSIVRAERLIIGSFLVRGDQLTINARLLDVGSGKLVQGSATNVTGTVKDLLNLSHRLASQLHRRLTGSDLSFDNRLEPAEPEASARPTFPEPAARTPTRDRDYESAAMNSVLRNRLVPFGVSPNATLTERDLMGLISRLSRLTSVQTDNPVTPERSSAPVNRLRVITAFVKLFVAPENMGIFRQGGYELPPDGGAIPEWGRPYVIAALEHGWWTTDRPVKPRDPATWAFVSALLAQMPLATEPGSLPSDLPTGDFASVPFRPGLPTDPNAYTGLIVDATQFRLQRDMTVRILDEEGNIVYPDQRYLPDYSFLLDHGMVAYSERTREAHRSGSRPLIVQAIGISGPGHDDIVVSNRVAERIREANRTGKFLYRWAVSVLVR